MPLYLRPITPAGKQINGVASYAGDLYAIEFDGHLYRIVAGAYVQVAPALPATIIAIAYMVAAADGIYAMDTFSFTNRVYKWDGVSAWTFVVPPAGFRVQGLEVLLGNLIVLSVANSGGDIIVYQYVASVFTQLYASVGGVSLYMHLVVFNSLLYLLYTGAGGGSAISGALVQVLGGVLVPKAPNVCNHEMNLAPTIDITVSFGGELYFMHTPPLDTTHAGSLFKWDGVSAWVSVVPWTTQYKEGMSLAVKGGTRLVGAYNAQGIALFNGVNAWVLQKPGTNYTVKGIAGTVYAWQGSESLYTVEDAPTSVFQFGGL